MQEFSEQALAEQGLAEQDVRRAAMDLLARREHSYAELSYKLRKRFPPERIENALQRLVDEGLQSDERFTEAYVYSRSNKGYGPARIRNELIQKGVSQNLLANYLFDDDEKWFSEASRLKDKKIGEQKKLSPKDRMKVYRFLAQRGFLSSHINACLG
ncbi:regulatory protein RecX [Endozoicomonas lisbonensis]|uniref:Regulatory protein RecX n=1 Tax=Endozoicomonas lisbonensis TaxID=3120522 RepID=A0ABV2SBW1_9GAMM